jgi:hypothetical protein
MQVFTAVHMLQGELCPLEIKVFSTHDAAKAYRENVGVEQFNDGYDDDNDEGYLTNAEKAKKYWDYAIDGIVINGPIEVEDGT